MKKPANQTAKVDAFMAELDHPFKQEVEAIRAIIKGVHPEIREEIKWAAPSFSYRDYLVTFNLWEKKRVHLVFHNPHIASISSPLLEGDYEHRRMAYFADMDDIRAKQAELERVIRELVTRMDQSDGASAPAETASDLPSSIGKPATRALTAAGYTRLEQLTAAREADLLKLHGVGPKAVGILRDALADRGLSFAG